MFIVYYILLYSPWNKTWFLAVIVENFVFWVYLHLGYINKVDRYGLLLI